jgi:hypothetical protein
MANIYTFSIKNKNKKAVVLVEELQKEADEEGVSFSHKILKLIETYYKTKKENGTLQH